MTLLMPETVEALRQLKETLAEQLGEKAQQTLAALDAYVEKASDYEAKRSALEAKAVQP